MMIQGCIKHCNASEIREIIFILKCLQFKILSFYKNIQIDEYNDD